MKPRRATEFSAASPSNDTCEPNVSVAPTNGTWLHDFRDALLNLLVLHTRQYPVWDATAVFRRTNVGTRRRNHCSDLTRTSVSRDPALLVAELSGALAICVYDDTQPVAGLLHLRYVATSNDQPLDLTDNTLSSGLLLMDRFCKELRAAGGRKQSWRVSIFGHTPQTPGMAGPAATVLDLAKAYFADGRLPVECKEAVRPLGTHRQAGLRARAYLGQRYARHGNGCEVCCAGGLGAADSRVIGPLSSWACARQVRSTRLQL